jgi:hypothetical protein
MKEEHAFERLTARALYRLLRASALRRDVLRSGPRATASELMRLYETVTDVRQFWRDHGTTGGHTGSPPE